jgi:uncharacterized protein YtpQ (UPF0354 family)
MFGLFKKKSPPPLAEERPVAHPKLALEVLQTIVPVVKAIEFESASARQIELAADDAPIAEEFVADLLIMYAEDQPDVFRFISARRLRELGLTREELHAQALLNLPHRPPKIEIHGQAPKQMVVAGGNFEAAMLLYGDLWEQVGRTLSGDILAVAPARDLLFFSDSAWPGAREFLNDVANRDLADKSHALSRCILRRTDGKWVNDAAAS